MFMSIEMKGVGEKATDLINHLSRLYQLQIMRLVKLKNSEVVQVGK
jgi:hypothetical protein